MASEVLTVEQAAKALKVGRSTGYRLAASGVLPTIRLGERIIRVPRTALEVLMNGGGSAEKGGTCSLD